MVDFAISQIAQELRMSQGQVAATLSLLDDGATVPFIARYRKENTASLGEVEAVNGDNCWVPYHVVNYESLTRQTIANKKATGINK